MYEFIITSNLNITVDWRLFNGSSPNEGRLEYRPVNGEWGSVCANVPGGDEPLLSERFLCEIVGFRKVMSYYTFSSPLLFGVSQGPTYDIVIRDQSYVIRENHMCHHSDVSSFRCTSGKYNCSPGTVVRPCPPPGSTHVLTGENMNG